MTILFTSSDPHPPIYTLAFCYLCSSLGFFLSVLSLPFMSVYPVIKMPAPATGKLHVAKIASYNELHAHRHRRPSHTTQPRRARMFSEGCNIQAVVQRDRPEALTPGAHRRTSMPSLNRPACPNTLLPSQSARTAASKTSSHNMLTPRKKTRSFTISTLPVIPATEDQEKQGATMRTILEDTSKSETQSEATDESVDPLETELSEFDPGFSFVTPKFFKSEEVLVAPKDVFLEAIEDDLEAGEVRVDRGAFSETAKILSGVSSPLVQQFPKAGDFTHN